MAFLYNIPQPTDQLSVSQANILNNFGILGAIAGNANASSASLNNTSGFNFVYFPVQGSAPTFTGTNVGLYCLNNSTTGVNELYIRKQDNSTVPLTASYINGITSGGSYLPSGIILQWGTGATASPTTFPMAFPTACLNVQAIARLSSGLPGTAQILGISSISRTQVNVSSPAASQNYFYMAIGY